MKNIRQFMQHTVKADDFEDFDSKMNIIFAQASKSDREPDVHYHDGLGLCATVRYWVSQDIPETISDEFALYEHRHYCPECEYYQPPKDKRIKNFICEHSGLHIWPEKEACDEYYIKLVKEGALNYGTLKSRIINQESLSLEQAPVL